MAPQPVQIFQWFDCFLCGMKLVGNPYYRFNQTRFVFYLKRTNFLNKFNLHLLLLWDERTF
jgi:hypothetical protein